MVVVVAVVVRDFFVVEVEVNYIINQLAIKAMKHKKILHQPGLSTMAIQVLEQAQGSVSPWIVSWAEIQHGKK